MKQSQIEYQHLVIREEMKERRLELSIQNARRPQPDKLTGKWAEREKSYAIINDEETEYVVFQPGDRVKCGNDKGIVVDTFNQGLFVNVKWDEGANRGTIYGAINYQGEKINNNNLIDK